MNFIGMKVNESAFQQACGVRKLIAEIMCSQGVPTTESADAPSFQGSNTHKISSVCGLDVPLLQYQCQCQSWIYIAHKRKASNALSYTQVTRIMLQKCHFHTKELKSFWTGGFSPSQSISHLIRQTSK